MNKECEKYRVVISQMLDGEHSEQEGNELHEHMIHCEKCRNEYEQFKRLDELVSVYPKEKLGVEFSEEFENNIALYIPEQRTSKENVFSFRKTYWAVSAAAAIVIMFLAGYMSGYFSSTHKTIPLKDMQIASVVAALGSIDRQSSEGVWDYVTPYQSIRNGDMLRTGDNGSVTLELSRNNEVSVENNTTVKVNQKIAKTTDYVFKLEKGEMEAQVRDLSGKFVVETAYGNIEVLGTIFKAEYKGETLRIRVDEGAVKFESSKDDKLIIEAGWVLIYKPGNYFYRKIKDIDEFNANVGRHNNIIADDNADTVSVSGAAPSIDYSKVLVFNNIPVSFPKDKFNIDNLKIDLTGFGYYDASREDIERIYNKALDEKLQKNISRSGLKFFKNDREHYIIVGISRFKTTKDRQNWWENIEPTEEPLRSLKEEGSDFGFWTFKSLGNVNLFCYKDNWVYSITIEKDPGSEAELKDSFYMDKLRDFILNSIIEEVEFQKN